MEEEHDRAGRADAGPLIRDVSDTARWVAVFRARESARPHALFNDPYAARLAGARGQAISTASPFHAKYAWSYVIRTWLFDRFVVAEVRAGADLVLNLAAGLDTRPYRLDLPSRLTWIEVDLPHLLEDKSNALGQERPRCVLERIPLDLANVDARRELFARIGARAARVVVLSEGLLIYLTRDGVAALARDLAAVPSFRRWVFDLASPGLLKMVQENSPALAQANLPLQFGPAEGPAFFEPHGWRPIAVESVFRNAARQKRVGWFARLFARLPERQPAGDRPWSGVCLLERIAG